MADDDSSALFLLTRLLSKMYPNSSISSFTNAEDALAHIVVTGTDILITNHGMGEMSGTELIEELRRRESKVPIIMMSGNPRVREDAMAAGADVFVEKSLSTTELEREVRRLLRE